MTPRIKVAIRGWNHLSKAGNAKPRHPGSSLPPVNRAVGIKYATYKYHAIAFEKSDSPPRTLYRTYCDTPIPIGNRKAPARYRITGIRNRKIFRNHSRSPEFPLLVQITMTAAIKGPKAPMTKNGIWRSSGTDDRAGMIMAQVMVKANAKYSTCQSG